MRNLLLASLILMVGCISDASNKNQVQTAKETLVRWQEMVDLGKFKEAEQLSTTTTIAWLKEISEIETDDTIFEPSRLQGISCEFEQDTAICTYYIEEEFEKLYNTTQLVKVNGVWLVDIHDVEEE